MMDLTKHRIPLFLPEDLEMLRISHNMSEGDMQAISHFEMSTDD